MVIPDVFLLNKILSLFRAILFPLLYLLLQQAMASCAYGIMYAVKKSEMPGLSAEMLENRVLAAYRASSVWFSLLSALLMFIILVLFFRFTGTGLTRIVRFRPLPSGKSLLRLTAVGVGLNLALMGLIRLIPFPQSWFAEHSQAISGLWGAGLLAQTLLVLLAAPFLEEILYRGLSMTYLAKGFSPAMVVLWQAVLFGAFHGTKLQLLYAFAAGLVLGIVCLQGGSVVSSMAVHAVFNGMSLLSSLLEWLSGRMEDASSLFWLTVCALALLIVLFGLGGNHLREKKPDCDRET